MIIKKLYEAVCLPYHMVIETLDGQLMKFYISPYRRVTEADLTPIPYYHTVGENAIEAADYRYSPYGLEKEANNG